MLIHYCESAISSVLSSFWPRWKRGMALLHALMCRWNTSMSLQRSLSASRIANCWLRCAVLFDIHTFSMYPLCIDLHTRARAIFFHIDTFCFAIQDMWKPFVHNFWGAHPMPTDKSCEHRTTEPRRPIVSTHLWMSEESALSNPLCRVALQASEYQNESQWSWVGLYSNQVFEGFTRFMNLVMLNQIISVLIHVLFIECDLLEECIRDFSWSTVWATMVGDSARYSSQPQDESAQKMYRSHFFDVCFGFVCFGFSALYFSYFGGFSNPPDCVRPAPCKPFWGFLYRFASRQIWRSFKLPQAARSHCDILPTL